MLWASLPSITQQSSLCYGNHAPQPKGSFLIFILLKHIWDCRPSLFLFLKHHLRLLLINTCPLSLPGKFFSVSSTSPWNVGGFQGLSLLPCSLLFFITLIPLSRSIHTCPWLQCLHISICCPDTFSTAWTYIFLLMTMHRCYKGTSTYHVQGQPHSLLHSLPANHIGPLLGKQHHLFSRCPNRL